MQPTTVFPAGNHAVSQVKKDVAIGEGIKVMQAGSWAAVAATDIPGGNRLVKFRPSDALKQTITKEDNTPVDPSTMRVVWLRPWDFQRKPLSVLTESIDQGPLLSMAYSEGENAVCIIFMRAYHARSFLEANANCVKRTGQSLFGPEVEVLEGQPYPMDEALQRMEHPLSERRRLTFARQRLFTDGMSEEQFKKDIFEIVGEQNVELVWLFNTGNGKSARCCQFEIQRG